MSLLAFTAVFTSLNKYFVYLMKNSYVKLGTVISIDSKKVKRRQHKGRPVRITPEFSMEALKAGQMYYRH